MNLTRRKFLASLATLPAIGLPSGTYMKWLEPNWFELTEKVVNLRYLTQPLKLLHLSDFHASPVVSLETIEEAIDLGLDQNPDFAVLTGDYITWELEDETAYIKILTKLSDSIPTFACLGNHDGGLWAGSSHGYTSIHRIKKLLNHSKIRLLHNQSTKATIAGQALTIAGLGDIWARDAQPKLVLNDIRNEHHPILVLSHNPDSKELLRNYDWDLVCCGHTHGGQLVIPIIGNRPFLPVRDKSFPEGLLSWGNRHIHITRGVGNLHGLRFNCRPEVSILKLVS